MKNENADSKEKTEKSEETSSEQTNKSEEKLITEEEHNAGSVKFSIYKFYLRGIQYLFHI